MCLSLIHMCNISCILPAASLTSSTNHGEASRLRALGFVEGETISEWKYWYCSAGALQSTHPRCDAHRINGVLINYWYP